MIEKLTMDVVANYINWDILAEKEDLSLVLIKKYEDKFDWSKLTQKYLFKPDFINQNVERVDWTYISRNIGLPEEMLSEYEDYIDWDWIVQSQIISEDFIQKNIDKLTWELVFQYQPLTEGFILRNITDSVYYADIIVKHQKLSEDFIRKFKTEYEKELSDGKFPLEKVGLYQKVSNKFLEEFKIEVPFHIWLYAKADAKLQEIIRSSEFEVKEDYVFGYTPIWEGGYIGQGLLHQYEVGQVHTSHADTDPRAERSFGFYVYTKDYYSNNPNVEKLMKVKIHKSDIAVLTHSKAQIRTFKFEVVDKVTL